MTPGITLSDAITALVAEMRCPRFSGQGIQ